MSRPLSREQMHLEPMAAVGLERKVMGWISALSQLIGTLAWPTAVLVLALLFRRQLRGLGAGREDRVSWRLNHDAGCDAA